MTAKVIQILDTIRTDQFIDTPSNREFYKDKGYTAKVVIIEKLKTGLLKSDTLEFTSSYSNCDPLYQLNESYLFFADRSDDGKFKMSHCTYWGPLEKAESALRTLRAKLEED